MRPRPAETQKAELRAGRRTGGPTRARPLAAPACRQPLTSGAGGRARPSRASAPRSRPPPAPPCPPCSPSLQARDRTQTGLARCSAFPPRAPVNRLQEPVNQRMNERGRKIPVLSHPLLAFRWKKAQWPLSQGRGTH